MKIKWERNEVRECPLVEEHLRVDSWVIKLKIRKSRENLMKIPSKILKKRSQLMDTSQAIKKFNILLILP